MSKVVTSEDYANSPIMNSYVKTDDPKHAVQQFVAQNDFNTIKKSLEDGLASGAITQDLFNKGLAEAAKIKGVDMYKEMESEDSKKGEMGETKEEEAAEHAKKGYEEGEEDDEDEEEEDDEMMEDDEDEDTQD